MKVAKSTQRKEDEESAQLKKWIAFRPTPPVFPGIWRMAQFRQEETAEQAKK
jgi:hypothetical protein